MRILAAGLLLALSACGDEKPTVTVNGRTIDVSGLPAGMPSGADLERLKAGNDKAAALGARALTAADIERFLAVKAAMTAAGTDPAKMEAALAGQGLSIQEWRVLGGRVITLVPLLKSGATHAKLAADMATAKPFLERLEAALQAK
jgi:hypothetical protein